MGGIPAILSGVADVFLPITTVLRAILNVFEPVTQPTVVLSVPSVFTAVYNVLREVPSVLPSVAYVFTEVTAERGGSDRADRVYSDLVRMEAHRWPQAHVYADRRGLGSHHDPLRFQRAG